jgi:hypothetical protein
MREGNADDNVFRFHLLRPANPDAGDSDGDGGANGDNSGGADGDKDGGVEARDPRDGCTAGRPQGGRPEKDPGSGLFGFVRGRRAEPKQGAVVSVRQAAADRRERAALRRPIVSELAAGLMSAHSELRTFVSIDALNVPDTPGYDSDRAALALNAAAESRLTELTREVLDGQKLSVPRTPVFELSDKLERLVALHSADVAYASPPEPQPSDGDDDPNGRPYIRSVGVADLLVVKQQIKRYEPGEIAHVENILAREKKVRMHRELNRTEEVFLFEAERTAEKESELEKTDRFELNQEASRTQEIDRETGFGLSLSGKYGPSVEFTSNLELHTSTTTQTAQSSAVTYARDVVERSKERIIDRVRTQRTTTIIREIEETNEHTLDNTTSAEHVVGIYQFLDKIYATQIFNYGIRQMFDFMIPEPASFVWQQELQPSETPDFPTPPMPLDDFAPDATFINEANYRVLAARYTAEVPKPPPPLFLVARATLNHGMSDDSESGQPRSVTKLELDVPAGYRPVLAFAKVTALTDTDESNTPAFAISVGEASKIWIGSNATNQPVGEHDYRLAESPLQLFDTTSSPRTVVDGAKLPMQVIGFESNNYSVNVKVLFAHEDARTYWQLETYALIVAAYQRQLADYEQRLAAAQSRREAETTEATTRIASQPPSINEQVVRRELRRHCISISRRAGFESFDATQDTDPPTYDFDEADEEGREVRFFEQAFEWDQIQYVFYPYFWGRQTMWAERFAKTHVDPAYLEFLQAGSARVVVPVRPGFEEAVSYYMVTGEIWSGSDDLPEIGDELYLNIVEEIKERTGASRNELPVGTAWETRVPTSLVLLRASASLPRWKRVNADEWKWVPVRGIGGTDGNGGDDGGESDT